MLLWYNFGVDEKNVDPRKKAPRTEKKSPLHKLEL